MGQMRSAARALAPTHGPAALLEALDRFAGRTLEGSLATAAAAIIDPADRTIRYCLAGHPPLLLRGPDGTVVTLAAARRPLLGLDTGARPEQVISFASGSILVLFTDGLVERRGEIFDAGLSRLATALRSAAETDPASLCETLVEQSLPPSGRSDDTAILCAFLG
jgi:serine phosphatase RsbU (regulator of sigma subunit)